MTTRNGHTQFSIQCRIIEGKAYLVRISLLESGEPDTGQEIKIIKELGKPMKKDKSISTMSLEEMGDWLEECFRAARKRAIAAKKIEKG